MQAQGRRHRMRKLPDDRPLKDVTILRNYSKPSIGNLELYSDLSSAKGKSEVHDNKDAAKKRKFNKLETVSTTSFKNYGHFGFEPSFKKNLSSQKLASSLSLLCSNIKKEAYKQEDYPSPSQHQPNHASASASGLACGANLVVMSCLNCYLHVMVSDANPKCPKCWRGDCLLDMYR